MRGVEHDTELFWSVAEALFVAGACGIAFALGYALYRFIEGVARRRGVDVVRRQVTLQSSAAFIAIALVGTIAYALYPYMMMTLLVLRLVFVGSGAAH